MIHLLAIKKVKQSDLYVSKQKLANRVPKGQTLQSYLTCQQEQPPKTITKKKYDPHNRDGRNCITLGVDK